MEASNKIAMALVQQENESKLLEDSLKSKEDELNSLNEELAKSKTDPENGCRACHHGREKSPDGGKVHRYGA